MNDRTDSAVSKWLLIGLFGVAALSLAAGGDWVCRREARQIRNEKQSRSKAVAEGQSQQAAIWRKERLGDPRMNSTGIIPSPVVQQLEGCHDLGEAASANAVPRPGALSFMADEADEIRGQARRLGQLILAVTALCILVVAVVFDLRHKALRRNLSGAERERRRVEGEIRAAFYSITDGVISTDAAGRVARMNPVAEKLTGWGETEAIGKTLKQVFRIVDEMTEAEIEDPIRRVLREGAVANLADRTLLIARDGAERPIANSGATIRNEQGQIGGVVLVFRDQTEQRRAETMLRESEERYRVLFEGSPQGVLVADAETKRFVYANQSICKMLGYATDELARLGVADIHPENSLDHVVSEFESQLRGEKTLAHAIPCLRKDGTVFYADINSGAIVIENRKCNVGFFTDITERKKAEERQACMLGRLEGVNELREGLLLPGSPEHKFKRISRAAVELLDLDFCRIWTVKPGDLCNDGCIHAGAAEADHICRHRDKCLHLMASSGRYTHTDGDHRRVPVGAYKVGRVASGEDRKFLTNNVTTDPRVHNHAWAKSLGLTSFAGYKLRNGSGEPIGVLAAFAKHPILEEDDAFLDSLAETTSKVILDSQVQSELREKTNQALLATRAKSEFLANMSHEIRTPMTSILGYADLLLDDSLSAAKRKTFLTTVRRNAEHLLQLIDSILDLSKIESGKMAMDLGPCRLPATIADVASMMRPRADQRGNTLEVRYAGPLPETIHTDGTRIRQVLVNLVGNAVKFTENGTIRIGVSFLPQWRSGQSAVSVEVADTGIGIRQESLPHLFQPFTQAESSTTRKYGGTGLGLAISRQIVTMLGGELTVRSAPGQGSTFTVTIPAGDASGVHWLQSPGEVICEAEAGAPEALNAGALRGVRILLAEDSIDNQELLRVVLGGAGAEVEVVENGRLAVERAETGVFDVVLMDMSMPEMDGYQAARTLRDRGYRRPILALTANAMAEDRERCLAAGCDAHLAKPIDRKQLVEAAAQYAASNASPTEAPTAKPTRVAAPGPSEGISSHFADDPQLMDILPRFVQRLPSQLDALCETAEEGRLEGVQRLAHRLKGAGGSYGYPTLSEAAKSLEVAAQTLDIGAATAALAAVKDVCAAIRTGWTARTAEAGQS